MATDNFAASLFCVHNLYVVAVLDDGSSKLAVRLYNFNSGTLASGKAMRLHFFVCTISMS